MIRQKNENNGRIKGEHKNGLFKFNINGKRF